MNRVHSLLLPLLNPWATALAHHCRLPVMTPQARLGLDSSVTKSHWDRMPEFEPHICRVIRVSNWPFCVLMTVPGTAHKQPLLLLFAVVIFPAPSIPPLPPHLPSPCPPAVINHPAFHCLQDAVEHTAPTFGPFTYCPCLPIKSYLLIISLNKHLLRLVMGQALHWTFP